MTWPNGLLMARGASPFAAMPGDAPTFKTGGSAALPGQTRRLAVGLVELWPPGRLVTRAQASRSSWVDAADEALMVVLLVQESERASALWENFHGFIKPARFRAPSLSLSYWPR